MGELAVDHPVHAAVGTREKGSGFSYAVTDREKGGQTFSVGPELPFVSDPSPWGTLHPGIGATASQFAIIWVAATVLMPVVV